MNGLGRILLVEDDPKDVELTLTALEEYNLANEVVVVARRRGSARLPVPPRRLRARAPGKPGRDAARPEAAEGRRPRGAAADQGATSSLKNIPVVVLTSSREEQDLVASYELGVNAYVVKPVDFHEFVDAIKELGVFWAVINEPPPGSVRKK